MRQDTAHVVNPFNVPQWIAWIGATLAAAISMITYIHATFETKEFSKETRSQLERRLERMENKLDHLIAREAK